MPGSLPLVLLPGWGFDRRIWDDVLPLLRERSEVITLDLPGFGVACGMNEGPVSDLELVTTLLLAQMPTRCVLLGWSLGGMIATHIAIHHPHRIAGLITVGSNLKWVADNDWPGASADNFAAFFENLAQDFDPAKKHFCGVIARGDDKEKECVKILRTRLSSAPLENFLAGLRLLASIDNRTGFHHTGFAGLRMPGLHLFGEQDAMVPLAVEQQMRALNKRQRTQVLAQTAHAPFLGAPGKFVAAVETFMQTLPYRIDKKNIADSFSKAATTYDSAAQLQREIGEQLLVMLPAASPQRVLDLGCGTGVYSQWLQRKFPGAHIISLDLAMGMLREAQSSGRASSSLCGDAETLPLQTRSIEVIFSNLAIQWCQQPERLFAEMYRVLVPGGLCLLSTFVPGTLRELETAWQQVDNAVHTNHFFSADELCSVAATQGFSDIQCLNETATRYYGSVSGLMRELKAIGARNLNAGRQTGLMGKRKLLQLARAYEGFREGEQLPAHYETLLMVLKKEKEHG